MAFPKKAYLMKEILQYIHDGREHNIVKITTEMAKKFKLTDDERAEKTLIAGRLKFDVRVRWAVSELRKALLLKNIENKLGVLRITDSGIDVVHSNPSLINDNYLRRFLPYREWKKSTDNIKKINKETTVEKFSKKFGLVSYVDVLGTKEFWTNSNSQNIPTNWNKLVKKFYKLLKITIKNNTNITFNSFSDTIIITLENNNTDYLLKKFGMAAWSMITNSIECDIPIRGCFSIGNFFHKKNFFIGDAITEAARYYELPQWIGITASPSAHAKIEILSKKDPAIFTYYHKYPVSLKHSFEQDAWAIKWPELYETMNNNHNVSNKILNIIDKKLEKITDVEIALKWRNTRRFYNDVLNNYIDE